MLAKHTVRDETSADAISCLGANYLSLLREAVFVEPEEASKVFALPASSVTYTLGHITDHIARRVGSTGGLPYSIGNELANEGALAKVGQHGKGLQGITLEMEEIYSRSDIGYEPRWRLRALQHALAHWGLVASLAREDELLAVLLFNLHSIRFARAVSKLNPDEVADLTLATWKMQPLQSVNGLHAAIGFAAAGASPDRILSFRLSGSASARG